jgi:hypothetical protein
MATPGTKINLVVASGYRDFKLPVALPRTTAALDMCVYVDGKHVPKFDDNNFIPQNTVELLLTTQKEEYTVLVKLRKHKTAEWISYREYTVNCLEQRIVSQLQHAEDSRFYEDIDITTTTTTTTTTTEFFNP